MKQLSIDKMNDKNGLEMIKIQLTANTVNIYNMNNGNGTEINEIYLTAVIYSEQLSIYTI